MQKRYAPAEDALGFVKIGTLLTVSRLGLPYWWVEMLPTTTLVAFLIVDALTGISPAKLLFAARVRDLKDDRADLLQLVCRATLKWLFLIIVMLVSLSPRAVQVSGVGWLALAAFLANLVSVTLVPFTQRKQTWYDMATLTLVRTKLGPIRHRTRGRGFEVQTAPITDAVVVAEPSTEPEAPRESEPDPHRPT